MSIAEIIHSVDGRKRTFECELISIDAEKAVVKHLRKQDYDIGPTIIPAGGITRAIYWKSRNYHVWKMFAPDGELLGYYINIYENIQLSKDEILWTDLILDLWVDVWGNLYWLDEDEVRKFKSKDLLSVLQVSIIQKTKNYLERNYKTVISQANAHLEK